MPGHELRQMVKQMLEGPAGMRPSEIVVDAMVAYHRALDDDRPFLCVTNGETYLAGKADTLKGEVTPGATVTIEANGKTVSVLVAGHGWTLANPPCPPIRIIARQVQAQTVLRFPDSMWSHARAPD
jgi:hypothetical protein